MDHYNRVTNGSKSIIIPEKNNYSEVQNKIGRLVVSVVKESALEIFK